MNKKWEIKKSGWRYRKHVYGFKIVEHSTLGKPKYSR